MTDRSEAEKTLDLKSTKFITRAKNLKIEYNNLYAVVMTDRSEAEKTLDLKSTKFITRAKT